MRVLVVEDNMILSRNLVKYLIDRDIFAEAAFDGKQGLYKASTNFYDVIILDIKLPEIDGIELCKRLREKGVQTHIIMLTSLGTNKSIVTGLDAGADDYLVKPFDYSVLFARMGAIMRRSNINKSNTMITHGNIELDLQKSEIKQNGEIVPVTVKEFELFKYLLQNKGKTLSRKDIYQVVWGETHDDFLDSKTLNVHIGYLRKKFGENIIETKKGYGFLIR